MRNFMMALLLFVVANSGRVLADDSENLFIKMCDDTAFPIRGQACSAVGTVLEKKGNFISARKFYKKACDLYFGEGCNFLGVMYEGGSGVPKNKSEAAYFFSKACDFYSGAGCSNLSILLEGDLDNVKIFELTKKSCDFSFLRGCLRLAKLYSEGIGVERDDFKAFEIVTNVCDLAKSSVSGHGCFERSIFFLRGIGVKQDDSNAFASAKRACELESKFGCSGLGMLYEFGRGVRKNNEKALESYGKACDLKSAKGCENYVTLKKSM